MSPAGWGGRSERTSGGERKEQKEKGRGGQRGGRGTEYCVGERRRDEQNTKKDVVDYGHTVLPWQTGRKESPGGRSGVGGGESRVNNRAGKNMWKKEGEGRRKKSSGGDHGDSEARKHH